MIMIILITPTEFNVQITLLSLDWLFGWVFVYELSGCEFESSCSHLNFRFRACFEQGFPWHSGKYEYGFTLKRVRDMIRKYNHDYLIFESLFNLERVIDLTFECSISRSRDINVINILNICNSISRSYSICKKTSEDQISLFEIFCLI